MSGGITITIESDLSGLERRLGDAALKRAQSAFGRRVMEDSNYFVMYDTGATSRSAAVATAGDEVSWSTPYASEAYNSGHARTVKNPNAHTHWFEYAKSVRLGEWEKYVGSLLK